MAIAMEVVIDPNVIALARNAPLAMAGQTRFPHSRQDASASPLGGQIGLALGCSDAAASPDLANRRYASPRAPKTSALPMFWVHLELGVTRVARFSHQCNITFVGRSRNQNLGAATGQILNEVPFKYGEDPAMVRVLASGIARIRVWKATSPSEHERRSWQ